MLKILFFAALRERLACANTTLDITGQHLTAREVLNKLASQSAHWQQHLANAELLCAVNQQLVDLSHPVAAGDELAFFPPVTGG
ncbi:molybdopterin converting factor, subunit 1 [Alishewanella agri BL06]|uniref:Molybdopterin synthase sulfur carrier subunit n=1 Tax=Alishewanella agri BL06 TaxID=1195246 RepID=I9DQ01_9ALTE|nr:MoaD/ThiS family protein [Alishewanella agri]EIW88105.1 molybdopterin converting factor, subunit 1 [Alishewanella agri BL06]